MLKALRFGLHGVILVNALVALGAMLNLYWVGRPTSAAMMAVILAAYGGIKLIDGARRGD